MMIKVTFLKVGKNEVVGTYLLPILPKPGSIIHIEEQGQYWVTDICEYFITRDGNLKLVVYVEDK